MTECTYCHKDIETLRTRSGRQGSIPFICRRCGGYFCPGHRLPEKHNCPSRVKINPGDYWKDKLSVPKKKKFKQYIIALLLIILVAAAVVVVPK